MSMFYYQLYQLTLSSPIVFPELTPIAPCASCDIQLEYGAVDPTGFADATKQTPFFQTRPDKLWLHVKGIARFLVTHGRHIQVEPEPAADEQSIRLYVLGSCMGALLQQRQYLVLHANAVVIQNKAVLFAGASGKGKSTLAGAFQQLGHRVLTDDVCVINAQLQVVPGYPQIKLWQDSAEQLNIATNALRRIRLQVHKYAVPLPDASFHLEPCPVAAVYFLHSHHDEAVSFEQVTGFDCYQPLKNNSYRYAFVIGMGYEKQHLQQCSQLSHQATFWHLTRPEAGFQLEKLLCALEEHLGEQGLVI